MMILLLSIALLVGAIFIWKRNQKAPGSDLIKVMHERFRARGSQVRARDLLEQVPQFGRDTLLRNGGSFEFYVNEKIVALAAGTTQIYCYCNLMEYMDLTRAIEKKIMYNQDPPKAVSEAA